MLLYFSTSYFVLVSIGSVLCKSDRAHVPLLALSISKARLSSVYARIQFVTSSFISGLSRPSLSLEPAFSAMLRIARSRTFGANPRLLDPKPLNPKPDDASPVLGLLVLRPKPGIQPVPARLCYVLTLPF